MPVDFSVWTQFYMYRTGGLACQGLSLRLPRVNLGAPALPGGQPAGDCARESSVDQAPEAAPSDASVAPMTLPQLLTRGSHARKLRFRINRTRAEE